MSLQDKTERGGVATLRHPSRTLQHRALFRLLASQEQSFRPQELAARLAGAAAQAIL